mmetsp:Transcript_18411/g.48073  ORF Transcript_18411/g.48073 Transcript_18411/m.48073 type:complete len:209 (+) Transcript_18411:187-813(+)
MGSSKWQSRRMMTITMSAVLQTAAHLLHVIGGRRRTLPRPAIAPAAARAVITMLSLETLQSRPLSMVLDRSRAPLVTVATAPTLPPRGMTLFPLARPRRLPSLRLSANHPKYYSMRTTMSPPRNAVRWFLTMPPSASCRDHFLCCRSVRRTLRHRLSLAQLRPSMSMLVSLRRQNPPVQAQSHRLILRYLRRRGQRQRLVSTPLPTMR